VVVPDDPEKDQSNDTAGEEDLLSDAKLAR